MRYLMVLLAIVLIAAGIAYAKTGFDMGMGFGSGAATVSGPVTPTGNYLLIDGSGNYLLIDNASNKLLIDGAN